MLWKNLCFLMSFILENKNFFFWTCWWWNGLCTFSIVFATFMPMHINHQRHFLFKKQLNKNNCMICVSFKVCIIIWAWLIFMLNVNFPYLLLSSIDNINHILSYHIISYIVILYQIIYKSFTVCYCYYFMQTLRDFINNLFLGTFEWSNKIVTIYIP